MVVTKGEEITLRYIARQPDGSLWGFEHKPEIGTLDGVYAGVGGRYRFTEPVPWWETPGAGWEICLQPGIPGWIYDPAARDGLFGIEWEGWRDSLREL